MDLLTGLVARSLVVAEDHGFGTRYRLLETDPPVRRGTAREWGETETLRFAMPASMPLYGARGRALLWPRAAVWSGRSTSTGTTFARRSPLPSTPATPRLAVQLVANHPGPAQPPIPSAKCYGVRRRACSTCLELPTNPGIRAC